jgi:hypothetical protein
VPARDVFTARKRPEASVGGTYYGYGWSNSPYFAAQSSEARGHLLLPTKWTEDMLNAPARTVLALKSRVLVENYGPAGALWSLANLIGSLKVQANSGDQAWDTQAEEYFNRVTNSPLTFDAGGVFTLATYQVMMTYRRMVDGDAFTVFTTSQSGHGRVMGHEGLMVEQDDTQKSPEWVDGIRWNPQTRFPLAYNFIGRGPKGEQQNTVMPAHVVMHHMTKRSFSARRGTPALAHAINNFHDLIESDSFIKQAIKVASLIGLTRKSDPGPTGTPHNLGLGAPLQQANYYPPTASTAPTTKPAAQLKFEEAVEGGLMSTAPFEIVHDGRPHPNFQLYKMALMRETASGLGISPQLLFCMDDPGGAWSRILLDKDAKAIADHHSYYLAPMVRRTWAYVVALGIKKGDVKAPQRGNWMKIRLTPPRSLTADIGRMGKLSIELRQHLQTTFARLYEEMGMDWEDELRQCAREAQYLIELEKEFALPAGYLTQSLFPQNAATSLVAPQPEPAPAAA